MQALSVGQTATLTAQVQPPGVQATYTWSVTPPGVLGLQPSGPTCLVTALTPGIATVTCQANTLNASVAFKVSSNVTGLTVSPAVPGPLNMGATVVLTAGPLPVGVSLGGAVPQWIVENATFPLDCIGPLQVSADGLTCSVTGLKPGTAALTCKLDLAGVTYQVPVAVQIVDGLSGLSIAVGPVQSQVTQP